VTENGLTVGAGSSTALPDNSLSQTLKDAGITITYVAPSTSPDGHGVTAPGVLVQVVRDLNQGTGPATISFSFGRAYARASEVAPAPIGPVGATTEGEPGAPAGSSALVSGTESRATPPGDRVPEAAPLGDRLPRGSNTSGNGASSDSNASPLAMPAALRVPNSDSTAIYLALIVAAAVLMASGALLRMIGVRSGWT
jgi:hypothetical protein